MIKKLYVGDIADDSYTILDRFGNPVSNISAFEIITITPSISNGSIVKIITDNNKIFSFQ